MAKKLDRTGFDWRLIGVIILVVVLYAGILWLYGTTQYLGGLIFIFAFLALVLLLLAYALARINKIVIHSLPLGIGFFVALVVVWGFGCVIACNFPSSDTIVYVYGPLFVLIASSIFLIYKEGRNFTSVVANLFVDVPSYFIFFLILAFFGPGCLCGSPLSTTCIAQSGYSCTNPIFHNNIFTVIVGQETGTSWTATNVIFVPQGTSVPASPTPGNLAPCTSPTTVSAMNANAFSGSQVGIVCATGDMPLGSYQSSVLTFISTHSPVAVPGVSAAGILEAYYQINGSDTWYQEQIATVNMKAV